MPRQSVEVDDAAVEDTEDDAFAVACGEAGDAEVDGLFVDAEFDTSVLWDASFGDVESAHDLDA